MSTQPNGSPQIPEYVSNLQAVYGLPSQAGYGSAVFYEWVERAEDLEQIALKYYRYFVGDRWERFGEAAWMTAWRQVYRRNRGDTPQIVAEMQGITDPTVAPLWPLLLTERDDADGAQQGLSAAYDDATVVDLAIYCLGDGAAMSGVLVAGRRHTGGTTFLVLLLD